MKKVCAVAAVCLCGCCCYVHRRVIAAAIKGEPIPEAPAWHFWVKNRKSN